MGSVGWALTLVLIGVLLLFVDIFLPTGGILLFTAAACFVISVLLGFFYDPSVGVMLLAGETGLLLALAFLFVRYWPKTRLGKRFLINPKELDSGEEENPLARLKQLVGKKGTAKSKMLPAGMIVIGGKKYDAVSTGQPIEPGQAVEVSSIDAGKIVVRPFYGTVEPESPPKPEEKAVDDFQDETGFEDPFA